jgi:hypothetical protein
MREHARPALGSPRFGVPLRGPALTVFTPSALRAEGVRAIGGIPGTAILYVITERRLCLMDLERVADRTLDAYALQLVVTWSEEHGLSNVQIARNLGITPQHLTEELRRAGYERLSLEDGKPRAKAFARRRERQGNRRGRVVRLKEIRA